MAVVKPSFPFRDRPIGTDRIEFWLSLQRHRLEREGVAPIVEERLSIEDEATACIGGAELGAMMRNEAASPFSLLENRRTLSLSTALCRKFMQADESMSLI
jgi:hypothetical protein